MRVLQVSLPDGAEFYTDKIDLPAAASSAQRYLRERKIGPEVGPLTRFTLLELTDKEYGALSATGEATTFFDK